MAWWFNSFSLDPAAEESIFCFFTKGCVRLPFLPHPRFLFFGANVTSLFSIRALDFSRKTLFSQSLAPFPSFPLSTCPLISLHGFIRFFSPIFPDYHRDSPVFLFFLLQPSPVFLFSRERVSLKSLLFFLRLLS